MACTDDTRTIDDVEYYCRQWPATKSITMKFRLIKTLGSAVTSLITAFKADDKAQMEAFRKGVELLFANANPEEVTKLLVDVVTSANRNGEKMNPTKFDEHFSGDLTTVYKVFIFVLEVNYKSFFKGQFAEKLLAEEKASK